MTALPTNPPEVPKLTQKCYLVIAEDGPGSAPLRHEHLVGHLKHVEQNWQRYVTAGPIREPGGDALVGSGFLVLADTLEDAKSLMDGDPYITCGMYGTVTYKEFSNAIGQYLGGKTWGDHASIAHRAAGGPVDDMAKGLDT